MGGAAEKKDSGSLGVCTGVSKGDPALVSGHGAAVLAAAKSSRGGSGFVAKLAPG